MKGKFIASGEDSGNTLRLAQPTQPYYTVLPVEDPFLRMLNQTETSYENPNLCTTDTVNISLH